MLNAGLGPNIFGCERIMSDITYDHVIEVDRRIYTLDVIYRVCYLFTDCWYIWLDYRSDILLAICFTPKSQANKSFAEIKGEFGNALIDYALRQHVSNETKEIREQLIITALSETQPKK